MRGTGRRAVQAGCGMVMSLLVVGCDGSSSLDAGRVPTVPAKGQVLRSDGKPVTSGTITFMPTLDGGSKNQAAGAIQPDGRFVLGSVAPEDGAVPGKYLVSVESQGIKTRKDKPVTAEVVAGSDLRIQLP